MRETGQGIAIGRNKFLVKEERRTRGHGVTLPKKQCNYILENSNFLIEQEINGPDYQLVV